MTSSSTSGTTTPGPSSTPSDRQSRVPKLDLSLTQLIATGFAGITATFLASYLGVTGTIIGAAVVSMATAIGNAVYGQSLRTTRDKVREVVPIGRADPASPTIVLPVTEDDGDGAATTATDVETDAEPPTLPTAAVDAAMPARAWRRVAFVAVGMFAGLLALVTSIEIFAGRPISDVIRGESGHGTSIGGGGSGRQQPAVPTVTQTVTPKVVVVTGDTVTRTAPARTTTTTPTETTSGSTSGSTTSTSGTPTTTTPTGTPTSPTRSRP